MWIWWCPVAWQSNEQWTTNKIDIFECECESCEFESKLVAVVLWKGRAVTYDTRQKDDRKFAFNDSFPFASDFFLLVPSQLPFVLCSMRHAMTIWLTELRCTIHLASYTLYFSSIYKTLKRSRHTNISAFSTYDLQNIFLVRFYSLLIRSDVGGGVTTITTAFPPSYS